MRKFLVASIVAIGAVYMAGLAYLFIEQRTLLYPLKAEIADISKTGIPHLQQIKIKTSDGETLNAWHVPPRGNKPVLLYFQGNAGNLAHPERVYAFKKLTAEAPACSPSAIAVMAAQPGNLRKQACASMRWRFMTRACGVMARRGFSRSAIHSGPASRQGWRWRKKSWV